jgi:hypothetical protein
MGAVTTAPSSEMAASASRQDFRAPGAAPPTGAVETPTGDEHSRAEAASATVPVERGAAPPHDEVDVTVAPGASAIPRWLQVLAAVIAPSTFITALAFYFGWTRADAEFRYFGLDSSMLGFTTQDYILRSADVVFILLGALLGVALLGLWSYPPVGRYVRRHPRVLPYIARALIPLGGGLVAMGAVAAWQGLPFPTPFLVPQLSPGVGVALLAGGLRSRQPRWRGWSSALSSALVGLLIVLSLFWATSECAKAVGQDRARQITDGLLDQPGVLVYSRDRLSIQAPGVIETTVGDVDAAYRYRYKGLRWLLRTGGNYLLLPALWSPTDGVAIVLPDTHSIRLEFTKGVSP